MVAPPTPAEAIAAFDRLSEQDRRVVFETLFRIVANRSRAVVNWEALLNPRRPVRGISDAAMDDLIARLRSEGKEAE